MESLVKPDKLANMALLVLLLDLVEDLFLNPVHQVLKEDLQMEPVARTAYKGITVPLLRSLSYLFPVLLGIIAKKGLVILRSVKLARISLTGELYNKTIAWIAVMVITALQDLTKCCHVLLDFTVIVAQHHQFHAVLVLFRLI